MVARRRSLTGGAPNWLGIGLPSLTLLLGAMHTGAAIQQQSMNEDGIQYLDIAAAVAGGDWSMAVNQVWSPLYPVALGGTLALFNPSVWNEFPAAHLTNFGLFAIALACFAFFWSAVTSRYYGNASSDHAVIPPALWIALGYSLFAWSSLHLIEIWSVTPDMMVAALVYVAAGLFLRLESNRGACWMLFGVVLGLGYLAKAALFPIGAIAIAFSGAIRGGWTTSVRRVAYALLGFAVVAAPLVMALSVRSGRLTFGEAGRFAYLKHVNALAYPDWRGTTGSVGGTPVHPPRLIFSEPPVYEFADPIAGTYPLGFNPAYWTEGFTPRFDLIQQLRALARNTGFYVDLFVRIQGGFSAVVVLLGALAVWSGRLGRVDREMILVAWSIAALGMYALVHSEGRYISPFVVLFWTGILGVVRLPKSILHTRVATIGAAVLVGCVVVNIGLQNLAGLQALAPSLAGGHAEAEHAAPAAPQRRKVSDAAVAEELQRRGLKAGDRVAFVGHSFTAFWAHLARLKIVAAIQPQDTDQFWKAPNRVHEAIATQLRTVGAVAIIAAPLQEQSPAPGWEPIGDTGYLLWQIREPL